MSSTIPFGKYQGKGWDDVPVKWVQFIASEKSGVDEKFVKRAIEELHNRGLNVPDLRIYMSALNSASIYCWDLFKDREDKNKGIYTWLLNKAKMALDNGNPLDPNCELISYEGMLFKFRYGYSSPTLRFVGKDKKEYE